MICFHFAITTQAAPEFMNFQAKIKKPDGSNLESNDVSYRFIYKNDSGSCTVFIEDFNNLSMVGSAGNISLKLGSGAKVFPATATKLIQTFNNNTSNTMDCFEGGTYAPSLSNERRLLRVEFSYLGSGGLQTISGIEINSTPYAMYSTDSEKLGGYAASLFAKFSDVTTCGAGNFLRFDGFNFSCTAPANFSGILSGDVTGAQSATVVTKLRGVNVTATAPILNQVLQFDGTNWVPATITSGGGTVTSVGATFPITSTGGANPNIAMPAAATAQNGYLTSSDWNTFNSKLGAASTLSGDVSGTSSTTSVDKIKGTSVVITAITSGNFLKYNGTNWVNSTPAISDITNLTTQLSNKIDVSQIPASCTASQTLTFLSPSGAWSCSSIAGLDAGVLTTGTIANARLPASATYWSAATGGINYAGGNVGIGNATPGAKLEINGASGTTLKIVDGNQALGKVLTSDAAGQASWAAAPAAFQGTVNITTTPYTITSGQNGTYFTYAGATAGVVNLPAISGLSDGFQFTIVRDVAKNLTITPNGADTFPSGVTTIEMLGQNIQSLTLTKLGTKWRLSNKTDDCIIGQSCWGTGNIYIGAINGKQYFITPGGCTNSATPTCANGNDTTAKAWANNSGTTAFNVATGANNFYEGKAQSAMLAASYTDTDAAKYCENMTYAGYSDWYLPARGEFLYLIYPNADNIQGFTTSSYWTSTEWGNNSDAWSWYGFGTYMTSGGKTTISNVRCIRSF